MFRKQDKSSPTHSERVSKPTSWGDNGPARPTTKAYRDNWDAIFGKKDEENSEKYVDKEK